MDQQYFPGDIVLVHGEGFFDKLIQFGQARRYPAEDAYWNHVALIVSPDGDLIEAIGKGVKKTHITKYTQSFSKYKIIHTNLSAEDQQEAILFATYCIKDGYGWTTILSTALCLLFGLKFAFGFKGQDICSGLVGRALEHGGQNLYNDAMHMTPADIVKRFSS